MPWQRDEGQGTRHTRDDGNQGGVGRVGVEVQRKLEQRA